MPRKSRESRETIAIQPSKGKKISFDAKSDRQVDNIPQGSTSFTSAFSSAELQSDEESDDEAPEAVGLSEVKELEDQEAQQEETCVHPAARGDDPAESDAEKRERGGKRPPNGCAR